MTYTEEEMNEQNTTLGEFNNSLNFVFGLNGLADDFDLLNNPYFSYVGFKVHATEDHPFTFSEAYELEYCSYEYMEIFRQMNPKVTQIFYSRALCFKHRDQVIFKNSFRFSEYDMPHMGIFYCKNTTENNNWCKSKDLTDELLLAHPSYFALQETRV